MTASKTPDAASTTTTWPELAIGLFDQLTRRNAQITYQFEDFDVEVPSRVGGEAPRALWSVRGTLHIRTRDDS